MKWSQSSFLCVLLVHIILVTKWFPILISFTYNLVSVYGKPPPNSFKATTCNRTMSILFMWNHITTWADLPPPEFPGILSSSFLSCLGFMFEPFSAQSLGSCLCSFCSKTKSFHVKTSTLSVTGHFYTFACLPCSGIQIFSFRYILNTTRKNISVGISLLPPFSFQGSRDLFSFCFI